MQKYVPSLSVPMKEIIPGSNLQNEKSLIDTVVGGDLLSSIYVRGGSELIAHRLNGFFIMSEDWHTLVCYLEIYSMVV